MTLSAGARLGPYEVLAPIEAGGMGEVYRARDPRIGREVAIKVLPESFARDRDRLRRFEQEARAAGALNHPALLTIHDIGEQDATPYIVSELLEGETLRARLRGGALSPWRAIDYGIQIARGLAAAHEKGIVHRDIKPENIFITKDGRAKILDFGLAKVQMPSSSDQTEPGTVMGTAAYMSPEQVRGQSVDKRSDIFSLGTTLLEAVSGTSPFKRDSSAETMSAILTDDPQAVSNSSLGKVIARCLEKHPEARYQSAADLAFQLEDIKDTLDRADILLVPRTRAAPPAIRVIVLPFRMLRANDDLHFLAYSLPDAIVGSLAGLGSLIVRSSLAAARYADSPLDIARIATEQDVNAIVSGTILAAGGRLRVSAQLTEIPGASVKWSHAMETSLDDIFGVQDELTRKIVRSLSGQITASDSNALRKDVPQSPVAYEFFLRANQQAHAPEGWLMARDLYRRSLDQDPNFAPAWARLGRVLWIISRYTEEPGDSFDLAEEALRRAMELNPDLSLAQRVYAELEVERGGTLDALRRLKERVRLQPTDPDLASALGKALRYGGLLHESLEAFARVRDLDPKMPTSVPHTWFQLGEYERAHATIHRDIFYMEPLTLFMLGRRDEAKHRLREVLDRHPDRQFRAYHETLLWTIEGDHDAALRALDIVVARNRDPEALFYMGRSYARIGERDEALDLLERVSRSFFAVRSFEHDPWLDPLRDSPRFAEIVSTAAEGQRQARRVWDNG